MPVSPTSREAVILDNIRTLIARTAMFKTWVGETVEADAKARVYVDERQEPIFPFALVREEDSEAEQAATGVVFSETRPYMIIFSAEISGDYVGDDEQTDAAYEFMNAVGAVIDQMKVLSASANPIHVDSWGEGPPVRNAADTVKAEGHWFKKFLTLMVLPTFTGS